MKARELEELGNGYRRYFVRFEELVSNVFYMINSSGIEMDDMKFDLFDIYLDYTKKEFNEHKIQINSLIGYFEWKAMEENGVFAPYQKDPNSKYFDGIKMINKITEKEYVEKYQNHPEECLNILINEKIKNILVEEYKSMNWHRFRNK